jgi:hypothetical protein
MAARLIVLFALMSIHCFAITNTVLPSIKTKKPIDPVVFSVNLPKDQAWQKVMDLFVANSIPIKLMDKSSGLIQSEKVGLGTHYGLKGSNDSTVWAFCDALPSPEGTGYYLFPQVINTELQVYVREIDAQNVFVSVNLLNSKATYRDPNTEIERDLDIQTSKRLEEIIANFVKTNEKMPNITFDPPFATYGEPPSQTRKRLGLTTNMTVKEKEKTETVNAVGWVVGIGVVIGLFMMLGNTKNE